MTYSIDDLQRLAKAAGSCLAGMNATEAFVLMQAGVELGIPPMNATRILRLIKGRITTSPEAMLSLAGKAGIRHEWAETTDKAATLRLSREGYAPHEHSFTIEDAKRAGLLSGDQWRKYPPAMLRARCVSAAVRAYCPDVISGIYTPEEVLSFAGDEPDPPRQDPIGDEPDPLQPKRDAAEALLRAGGVIGDFQATYGPPSEWTASVLGAIRATVADVAKAAGVPPARWPEASADERERIGEAVQAALFGGEE